MNDFDLGWYYYCHKDKKKQHNKTYYKKHREEILEQKKEYYKRKKKMGELEEKIKRIEKIVAINNKSLCSLRPIIKCIAKQIGYNSMDINKLIEGIKKNLDIDLEENSIPKKECDVELQLYIRRMFL